MNNKENSSKQMGILLSLISCFLIISILVQAKSIYQSEVLAEAESIAEVERQKEEHDKWRENLIRKAPLHDKYVEQFLELNGTDSAGWHIEVINRIYPYLEYREIGDKIQLVFTPEADAQLTYWELDKIWGNELVGFYDAAYENVITEEFIKPEDSYDYDESDDSDAGGNNSPGYHAVKGYIRTYSNGSSTYVDGHFRSNPDGNKSNNLSSPN